MNRPVQIALVSAVCFVAHVTAIFKKDSRDILGSYTRLFVETERIWKNYASQNHRIYYSFYDSFYESIYSKEYYYPFLLKMDKQ